MDSLIVFYLYLVNAQMNWLLYIWQKLTVYIRSCMDVKSGHWLITVSTPSALHGTIVLGEILSVVDVRALNSLRFSVKQCQWHILLISEKWFLEKKISQSENNVLKTLAYLKRNMCNALRSTYGLCSYDGIDAIKYAVCKIFFRSSCCLCF